MERTSRYGKKRAAILSAIQSTDCHPSAEWVYQTLKPEHPDLSLGTVYRNLIFLRERGDIRSLGVIGGQERFDCHTHPHCHFVCEDCGAILDLPSISTAAGLDKQVSAEYGLEVQHHDLTFFGHCRECGKKQPV